MKIRGFSYLRHSEKYVSLIFGKLDKLLLKSLYRLGLDKPSFLVEGLDI